VCRRECIVTWRSLAAFSAGSHTPDAGGCRGSERARGRHEHRGLDRLTVPFALDAAERPEHLIATIYARPRRQRGSSQGGSPVVALAMMLSEECYVT
jgi:hypothetical protein